MDRPGLKGGFVGFVLFTLTSGCDPFFGGGTAVLNEVLDMEANIGGSDTRLIFTREDAPDLPNIDVWALLVDPQGTTQQIDAAVQGYTIKTQVAAVDPSTLDVSYLGDDIFGGIGGGVGYGIYEQASDGRWIVWTDYETDLVRVYDMDTQTRSTFGAGLPGYGFMVVDVEDNWVLGSFYRGDEHVVVVHNLLTGQEYDVLLNQAGDGASISGDVVALQYYPDLFPGSEGPVVLDGLELDPLLASKVDVLNLTTGERRTVVTDLGPMDTAQVAGEVIWIYSESDSGVARIKVHDLATSTTRTVLEFAVPINDSEYKYMASVGAIGALTEYSSYDDSGSRELWELVTPDGQVKTVLDYTYSYDPWSWSMPLYSWPRIVGSRVVYQDPDTRDWVIYNPADESRQTVRPFE